MRDPITINAICWMILHQKQVAAIPNTHKDESGVVTTIRQMCVDGQVAFDEETEQTLLGNDGEKCIPDWEALTEVFKAIMRFRDAL